MSGRAIGDTLVEVAGVAQAVAATASPMSITNTGPSVQILYFTIPTGVTATIARGAITLLSVLTPAATTIPATILLGPGHTVVFTYNAGAPTIASDTH